MTPSLFHPEWHFVADLQFFIRTEVQVSFHKYKNQPTYILRNPISGRTFKVNERTWKLVSRLDGIRTVQEIWGQMVKDDKSDAPTQSDIIEVLNSLHHSALISCHELPDTQELTDRHQTQNLQTKLQKLKSPLSIKIPLWDPDQFLSSTYPTVARLVFNPFAFLLAIITCVTALIVCSTNFSEITSSTTDQLFALENVISFSLLYPVIKAIHELGHGYVLKHYGGRSHEIGLMFLLFFPVPYIDASESTLFPNKWARLNVAMAGIWVELLIASCAIITWSFLEPGLVRAICFNIFIIAGVSTVLFNGNPLLRFDAYYALSDLLETPNLTKEANRTVGEAIKSMVLAGKNITQWPTGRTTLLIYSVAAFIYRIVIFLVISTYLISNFFFLGAALAILGVYTTLIKPMFWLMKQPMSDTDLKRYPYRTWTAVIIVCFCSIYGVFFHEIQWSYVTTAIARPALGSEVRAPISGVLRIQPSTEKAVKAGEPLWIITPTRLEYESQRVAAQIEQTKAELQANTKASDRKKLENTLQYLEKTGQDVFQKLSSGLVRAPTDGSVFLPNQNQIENSFVYQGDLLGYVLNAGSFQLVTQIPELDYSDFSSRVSHIEFYLPSTAESGQTSIISVNSRTSNVISHEQLLIDNGGDLAAQVGPNGDQLSIHNLVQLRLLAPTGVRSLNERVLVRFVQKAQPLAPIFYRVIKRNFLSLIDS